MEQGGLRDGFGKQTWHHRLSGACRGRRAYQQKKAVELFESGLLNSLESGTFESLKAIHKPHVNTISHRNQMHRLDALHRIVKRHRKLIQFRVRVTNTCTIKQLLSRKDKKDITDKNNLTFNRFRVNTLHEILRKGDALYD